MIIRNGGRPISNPINPRQLEAFRGVILTGTMTAAGEMLRISQPAVSRLIRDLEQDLGLHLFERNGARITPTDEALMLYEDVERFFVGSERIREAVAAIRELSAGNLRIAAMPNISLGYLPTILDEFLADRPRVSVVVHSDNAVSVIDLVSRHQFDIGLAYVVSDHPSIRVKPLPETEAVCALPVDHPLAEKETIDARDLIGENLIVLGHTSLLRHNILAAFQSSRVKPRIRLETRYAATACACVSRGLGIAIIDPFVPLTVASDRIAIRAFRPRLTYSFSLIFPARRPPSGLAKEFGDLVHKRITQDFASAIPTHMIPSDQEFVAVPPHDPDESRDQAGHRRRCPVWATLFLQG